MFWHILTIIFTGLIILLGFSPSLYKDFYELILYEQVVYLFIIFAAVAIMSASLALGSYRKLLKK
jgi:hypothetical protein